MKYYENPVKCEVFYNNQINARSPIGPESAAGYCADKPPTEKSRVFWFII